jgi:hypothetical protein
VALGQSSPGASCTLCCAWEECRSQVWSAWKISRLLSGLNMFSSESAVLQNWEDFFFLLPFSPQNDTALISAFIWYNGAVMFYVNPY